MTDAVVVYVTAGSEPEAERLAKIVLEARRAACVNIVGPIRSLYRWDNRLQDEREWLLILKTQRDQVAAISELIQAVHSYELPEIIALPLTQGNRTYLNWIGANTQFTKAKSSPRPPKPPFPIA